MREQTQAEIPPFASCWITPFVIAESPFRPPSLRFDNLAKSWLSTGKSTVFQFGCAFLRWIRDNTQGQAMGCDGSPSAAKVQNLVNISVTYQRCADLAVRDICRCRAR
jgi:hypothetical protein